MSSVTSHPSINSDVAVKSVDASESTSPASCPVTTFSDIQYYVQISVLLITTVLCLAAIIADPDGPNVRYFQSVATFCVGLFLPNPKQPTQSPTATI